MAETEGVEAAVESKGRSSKCRKKLKKLLKRLDEQCERITIFIQSGSKCCKLTGCLCDVNDCFAVLIDTNDTCQRTYIAMDCICAVKTCVEDRCSN